MYRVKHPKTRPESPAVGVWGPTVFGEVRDYLDVVNKMMMCPEIISTTFVTVTLVVTSTTKPSSLGYN